MSDADIVKEFLVESYENLDRLDQDLIALEKDPRSRDTLASIFRTIHTIKGTSGFLAFNRLEAVTHVGESLLARLRDGLLALTPEITTALLAMVDAVRQMLANIEVQGNEGERNDAELIATLTRLLQPQAATTTAQPVVETPVTEVDASPAPAFTVQPPTEPDAIVPTPEIGEAGRPTESASPPTPAALPESSDAASPNAPVRGHGASDSTIRVDVSLLDQLMNLVGELVLARNQILQATNASEDGALVATRQRLNLITTELQEGVMKTRMQPIGNIWSKFPRIVRDVALGCGKQVRIEIEGKETELDKTIIEAIKDPLTHLVRNAVDHGIESPAARQAAGKDPVGRLFLRAYHEGGQVNIEISDDGAGLDFERIRNKAVQKGLIAADHASRMTEREITNLIFLPGFSTAEKVTNVSGRGVGLDVVKTNIEKIGGTVDVQSRAGNGSTVRMKIPLTLAIIPALIVTSGGDRYAIPQVSLLELVRLEGDQARQGIELVHGAPVHRLRGRLLPLVYLNRELGTEGGHSPAAAGGGASHTLDFSVARDKHRQWIKTLRQVLDGKLAMTADQAGSHEKCALGQWLYPAGLDAYAAIAEIHTLEQTHKQFHGLVRETLKLKEQGELARAEQLLARIEQASGKIMELLTLVENKVFERDNANIVVLQAEDRSFGLVVDEINDTEEIVVKPLGKQLKSINTYAGATIMGDGRVALILDVLGLAQRAHVVGEARDRSLVEPADSKKKENQAAAADGAQHNAVLLFQYAGSRRMAIDLGLVARLEEFRRDAVEMAAGREVVQYRGQIMPLLRVSEVLGSASVELPADRNPERGKDHADSLHVVVYTGEGRSVGLVVDRILDIVEESFVVQPHTGRTGVVGSAVIQKRVTDMLDVSGLVRAAASGVV